MSGGMILAYKKKSAFQTKELVTEQIHTSIRSMHELDQAIQAAEQQEGTVPDMCVCVQILTDEHTHTAWFQVFAPK